MPHQSPPDELLRLRLAVEASGEVIFMTDPAGTITYVNPEFVRVYGYTPEEVVGRATPRILSGGVTPPAEYADFWRQLLERKVVRREFVNRTKAGALLQMDSSANPILRGSELLGFLAVQRDVTARNATDHALRQSERRYRTLADAAHDSIFIVNRDGRIEYANAASSERFGIRIEDAIGGRVHEVFRAADAADMWRELSAVFATGQRQYFEARFETATGDHWLGTWLVPMAGDGATVEAVMGVARDITARKQLEREFAQAQKMEAVGRLAGGIAHDFNNLLTAILGYSDLVGEGAALEPDIARDLAEIKKAGERASRLTRQLLTFSRKQTLSPEVLDVNGTIRELLKMLGRIIGEDIHIELAAAPALDRIKADPSQIEQVIVNLVVNARDAMPQGGRVWIDTANVVFDSTRTGNGNGLKAGRYVAITVADTGCGMTSDALAHVFEPFFTTKPAGKGTGLGLATAYGIVKQSGGDIAIESTPSVGTTVRVYLPSIADTCATPETAAAGVSSSGTETILLVEDEPGIAGLMLRILQNAGYKVLPTKDVGDAIDIASKYDGHIDLLLSDVVMPHMSGPEVAQRIVRIRPTIRVLYVSGFTSQAVFDHGMKSPRTHFLAKPFKPADLTRKVRECLDVQAQTAEEHDRV